MIPSERACVKASARLARSPSMGKLTGEMYAL
uniref:Uncharacterized protein n=1 Tax=Arundo donax TaxID=35708 RepID=A0A0A9EJ49_ARUDO